METFNAFVEPLNNLRLRPPTPHHNSGSINKSRRFKNCTPIKSIVMPINVNNFRFTGDTKNSLFTSAGGASFEDQLTDCAEKVLRINKPRRISALNSAIKSSSRQRYPISEL